MARCGHTHELPRSAILLKVLHWHTLFWIYSKVHTRAKQSDRVPRKHGPLQQSMQRAKRDTVTHKTKTACAHKWSCEPL